MIWVDWTHKSKYRDPWSGLKTQELGICFSQETQQEGGNKAADEDIASK